MIIEISSKSNPEYKKLKEVSRGNNDRLFIEGRKLFTEAVKSSIELEKVYVDKKNKSLLHSLLTNNSAPEIVFMKNDLIASTFTTESKPEGDDLVVSVAKRPKWQLKNLFERKQTLILLDRIQDSGNLGTILRSSLAFALDGIILTKNSVDPFNTKVIRASAGTVFNTPIVIIDNLKAFKAIVQEKEYRVIATSSHANKKPNDLSSNLPCVFLFGNEGTGLSKDLLNLADEVIAIPHLQNVESLNLGVAVSIVLWETYKDKLRIEN